MLSPTFTKILLTSHPSPRCHSGHICHLRCSPSPPIALMPARGGPVIICCGSPCPGHFSKAQSLPLVPVARCPLPHVSAGQPGALPTALWRPLWTDPMFAPQQLGDMSFPLVALTHPPAICHICVDVPFQFPGEWTLGPNGSSRFRFLRSSPAIVHSGHPAAPQQWTRVPTSTPPCLYLYYLSFDPAS